MFALGFCVELLSGRVPYDLGFAIGLGAVLALLRGRLALALVLAVLTSAASPVAGAFLALAGLAYALAAWREEHQGRDRGLALAAAALLPIVVLALAYPEGGYEPFAASAFWPALAGVLLIALLLPQGTLTPRARRTVRLGAALYALALIGAFALETPVGGNATRLAALLAAPLLAGVLWSRHRAALCLLAPVLLYWMLATPINDVSALAGNPSVEASYYAPLRSELRSPPPRRPHDRRGAADRAPTGRPPTWPDTTVSRSRAAGSASSTRATPRCSTARASPHPPTARGCKKTTSPTSRCPTRRSTTPGGPRERWWRTACRICAKSGARGIGACSRSFPRGCLPGERS